MSEVLKFIAGVDSRFLLGAFVLMLDAWCIGLVWRSAADLREKWLWCAVIVLCPIVGLLFWFVLGPKPEMLGRAD
jgi:hypothetical protein